MISQYEIIETIGWTLIHSFWQITLIGIVVKIFLLIYKNRSSVFKYNIALTGMLAIIISALITMVNYLPSFSNVANENTSLILKNTKSLIGISDNTTEMSAISLFAHLKSIAANNLQIIVLLWLTGVCFFSLRFAGGLIYIQRLKSKYSFPVRDKWEHSLTKIRNQFNIRKKVIMLESALTKVPIVIGHLRPALILPLGLLTSTPFNQLEAIMAHELAHIKRSDFIINIIISVLESFFFFHPVFWWISRVINTERENICDDMTIAYCGTKDHLQKALIDLYEFNQKPLHIAAALYRNNNQLLKRIKRMKTKNQLNHGKRGSLVSIAISLIGVLIIGFTTAFSPRPDDIPKNQAREITKTTELIEISRVAELPGQKTVNAHKIPVPLVLPDSSKNVKEKTNVKKQKDDGIFTLKLDADGNLINATKNGVPLEGKEREKFEKMTQQMKELKEKEKALIKNKEELENVKERLKETEEKMTEISSQYDETLEEYVKLSENLDPTENFETWSFYEENFKRAQEILELAELEHNLQGISNFDYFTDNQFNDEDLEFFEQEYFKDLQLDQLDKYEDLLKDIQMDQLLNQEQFMKQFEGFEDFKEIQENEFKGQRLETTIQNELINDDIIKGKDDLRSFRLSAKKLIINGEKQSTELRDKYLKIYEDLSGEELTGNAQVIIEE